MSSGVSSTRAMLLKEEVRLFENRKAAHHLQERASALTQKKIKCDSACEGLLKSASMVSPREGDLRGDSLMERARWMDKAYALRAHSKAESKKLASALQDLNPKRREAEQKVTNSRNKKEELEIALKRFKVKESLIKDTLEQNDISDMASLHYVSANDHASNTNTLRRS